MPIPHYRSMFETSPTPLDPFENFLQRHDATNNIYPNSPISYASKE